MKTFFRITFLFFTSITFAFSQAGTIRGYIKSAKTNEELIGASVIVQETNKGVASDINGYFTISSLKPNTYSVRVSYIGYSLKYIDNVVVNDGQVTELAIFLEEDDNAKSLNEVKVVGKRRTDTEISVISDIKATQQIVSGISAAQIAKTLDRNAAEVVKRVPGVTIFGDRFINIRGLNERYNTVLLNNSFTPSMESDVRSFSFDIIPSSQIDKILIFKSPAAELPGEFAGGVVKIFTKSIPDKNYLTIDLGGSFRNGSSNEKFFSPTTSSTFWTGFNDGYANLPQSFPSTENLKLYASFNPEQLTITGRSLKNNWVPKSSTSLPDLRFAITGALKLLDKSKVKLATISAVNYSNTNTIFDTQRGDFGYNEKAISEKVDILTNFRDIIYTNAVRFSVLNNWSLNVGENHSFEIKNLFNQLGNVQYVDRNGFENGSDWKNTSLDQIFRGIYSGQVLGRHDFPKANTKIDWVFGSNKSFRDQPDFKRYNYQVTLNAEPKLLVPQGVDAKSLGRISIALDENSLVGGLNLTKKIFFKNVKGITQSSFLELKTGLFVEDKQRTFSARNIGFIKSVGYSEETLGKLSVDKIFAQENINNENGVTIDEQTNASDSYDASNKQLAYYLSANYAFTKKLNLIVGARVENNAQRIKSFDISKNAPIDNNRKITDILPSANLTYNFSEKSLLRFAYGKTLNRPEFREISSFSFYDFLNNRVVRGNPELQNATIQNYDFRYEYYPSPAEMISFALFHKTFVNPIEIVFEGNANNNITFNNANTAKSTGIELDVKKSLGRTSSYTFLKNTSLVMNASFILSKVRFEGINADGQSNNRPLQGQSPYIINAGLNYNDVKKNMQFGITYNIIGKRIYAVGNSYNAGYPDWYEMPRNILDFTFSKQIVKNLILKGGVSDILNEKNLIIQDGNKDNVFDEKVDSVIQTFQPGSVYSLGLSFSFR
ncbi:MAG: TonB-dependent receptor [Pseudarcicella sp.]|nr:TonB-dependent receptor [Pseudarcicella sp.]